MGRHSIDSAPPAPAPPPGPGRTASTSAPPIAPITNPLLLDAVQRDLRRLRSGPPATDPGTAGPVPTRRVETPFSGPVDVPVDNVIGPHRPEPTDAWPLAAAPARPVPGGSRTVASGAAVRTPAARPGSAQRPVPARTAAPLTSGSTGPVVVPTHRSAPVPVEAPRELDDDQVDAPAPIGLSLRTLLLGSGIGLLAATALSLLTLIPR